MRRTQWHLIFTSGGLWKSSRKRITMNYWSAMISKHGQTWAFFVSLLLEELVKTHLRLTKKTTSPLKLSWKRWIQAWTQAWPLPPVKWLLRSQQWEKFLPNVLCKVFFRFWGPLIRGIPLVLSDSFFSTRKKVTQKGERGDFQKKSGMM